MCPKVRATVCIQATNRIRNVWRDRVAQYGKHLSFHYGFRFFDIPDQHHFAFRVNGQFCNFFQSFMVVNHRKYLLSSSAHRSFTFNLNSAFYFSSLLSLMISRKSFRQSSQIGNLNARYSLMSLSHVTHLYFGGSYSLRFISHAIAW